MDPYRDAPAPPLACPRCGAPLEETDVASCGCGTWVTAFAASVVLTEVDLRPDPITQWWRVRAPCPVCKVKMTLHGEEPGLLQGCAPHGYWIDTDTIACTGLSAGIDQAALREKREEEEENRDPDKRKRRAEEAERKKQTAREQAERAKHEDRERFERKQAEARDWAEAADRTARKKQQQREEVLAAHQQSAYRVGLDMDYLATLDPPMRALWLRLAELERKNEALETRVRVLERG